MTIRASPLHQNTTRRAPNRRMYAYEDFFEPGGTPLYKPCRYVPPQRIGFMRRFGLKTGIDFTHFGLELVMVFEETTGVYKCTCHFNSK